MGDFNLPTVTWSTYPPTSASLRDSAFLDCFCQLGFLQHILEPTFIPSGRTLDLVLSSGEDHVTNISSLTPLPGCGHVPITFSVPIELLNPFQLRPGTNSRFRDWFHGNYSAISRSIMEVDWYHEFLGLSLENAYSSFESLVDGLVDTFVPLRKPPSSSQVPWNKNTPNRFRQARAKAWSEFKVARSLYGRLSPQALCKWHLYSQSNSDIKNYKISTRIDYELELLQDIDRNPKRFHSYLKHFKTSRPRVGPIMTDDHLSDDPTIMAECFADAFYAVLNPVIIHPPYNHQETQTTISNVEFSLSDVKSVLSSLKSAGSMGPDCIHPCLLKSCSSAMALPLYLLFSKSLRIKSIPAPWKTSNISPIFKKGAHSDPLNYRPISLTSVCSKSMERIIVSAIHDYLDQNSILSPSQFGFRAGRSVQD